MPKVCPRLPARGPHLPLLTAALDLPDNSTKEISMEKQRQAPLQQHLGNLALDRNDKPRILWIPTLLSLAFCIGFIILMVHAFYILPITAVALILIKLVRASRR
jgi:hypothetical protein